MPYDSILRILKKNIEHKHTNKLITNIKYSINIGLKNVNILEGHYTGNF
jgi:hypothetical protein